MALILKTRTGKAIYIGDERLDIITVSNWRNKARAEADKL